MTITALRTQSPNLRRDPMSNRAPGRSRLLRRLPVAVAVALTLAACGSTVQMTSTATVGSDGLATTGGGLTSGTSGTSGGGVNSTTTGSGSTTSGSTGNGGTSGQVISGSTGQQSATTGSITQPTRTPGHEPIRVGVIYTPGLDAAASAIGISTLSTGDTSAQAAAVVKWVNARGGLGGHPIQLFKYAIDASASSQDAAYGAACTAMTQDYKVRYVVSILSMPPSMMPCLVKGGVGLLDDESGLGDATMAKYADFLGNPGEFAPGRKMSVMVEDLWKRGWLAPASKVGILAVDRADGHAVVDGALSTALRRHGLKSANTQYVNPNGGDGGSSQSSSAALQFNAAHVDRVISVLYSPLYFMNAAESQQYHPAYALDSSLGPGALLEGLVPNDQLKDAAGIGWQPYLDIKGGTHPGPVSSRETLCFDIMKNAGQASTAATTKGFQLQVCNVLFYLKDLGDRLPTVPRDLLTTGRALLANTFVSADTFRTDVRHRTDGVAGYRDLAFLWDCKCFQYVSPVQSTS